MYHCAKIVHVHTFLSAKYVNSYFKQNIFYQLLTGTALRCYHFIIKKIVLVPILSSLALSKCHSSILKIFILQPNVCTRYIQYFPSL